MPQSTRYPHLDTLLARLHALPRLGAEGLAAETIAVLGRKNGVLTAALRSVPSLPMEQRKSYGAAVNQLKARFEEAFARRGQALAAGNRQRAQASLDLTLPGRHRWTGAEH